MLLEAVPQTAYILVDRIYFIFDLAHYFIFGLGYLSSGVIKLLSKLLVRLGRSFLAAVLAA